MSTTAHAAPESQEAPREAKLPELLAHRDRLAARWAEAQSHDLPDAGALLVELVTLELTITQCFPEVYDGVFDGWISHDAALLHEPDVPRTGCPLCTSANDISPQAA